MSVDSSSVRSFLSVESLGPTEGLLKATMRHLDLNLGMREGCGHTMSRVKYNITLWARVGPVQVFSCPYFKVV